MIIGRHAQRNPRNANATLGIEDPVKFADFDTDRALTAAFSFDGLRLWEELGLGTILKDEIFMLVTICENDSRSSVVMLFWLGFGGCVQF